MHGVLPEELPPGATWVKPYSWSDDAVELSRTQPEFADTVDEQYPLEVLVQAPSA